MLSFIVFLWMEARMRCTIILKLPRSVEQNWETSTLPVCLVCISKRLASDTLFIYCCSISFKFYLKVLLTWADIKIHYSVKSSSCHFNCTIKENTNNTSGGHRAFSCMKHSAISNGFCASLWMRQRAKLSYAEADKVLMKCWFSPYSSMRETLIIQYTEVM